MHCKDLKYFQSMNDNMIKKDYLILYIKTK